MHTFEKLVNFRDLGGIPGAGGKTVAPRRLLRSGEPVNLPRRESDALAGAYHLANVIDLRSQRETQQHPDDAIPGAQYHHIDILRDAAGDAPDEENLQKVMQRPGAMDEFMLRVYRQMITDAAARAGFAQAVGLVLAQNRGATLFHCYAGKDRTGLLAAILLTLLGARREDIFEDYLKTNIQRKAANQKLLVNLGRQGVPQPQLEMLKTGLEVKENYLAHAYAVAGKEYGSFAAYIEKGLGIAAVQKEALRAMYLV